MKRTIHDLQTSNADASVESGIAITERNTRGHMKQTRNAFTATVPANGNSSDQVISQVRPVTRSYQSFGDHAKSLPTRIIYNFPTSDKMATEQRIKELKDKRRSFKAQITMFGNYVEKYQDSLQEFFKIKEKTERLHAQYIGFSWGQDVFDGSVKSSSGLSLNDTLLAGPTIQSDLFSLFLRFRMHVYVMIGDIEKMYRQFLVRPEDRAFQRILWRDEKNNVATYELNTVTFCLTVAPYLAIRCVLQFADDEKDQFPDVSTTVKRDLYVDDLLTGANTIKEARKLRIEILSLFERGGLDHEQIHPNILGDPTTMKTLSILWDARKDRILYTVEPPSSQTITKRTILSAITKIFDPLGLLGQVTITAKMIMQHD
ncbi:PREDICTED: uncharacterized protein LOC108577106 [Habropoda laboriosa]|uniref:uncharacterized protein LOC108577106 n=1 Tax=Habropoda laboriosa TaxID=597456 RepID=UPI00083E246A|nr:PREDICTED: uncharacterized protein LOC108577106 [Habropoda laboriosa]